jgi:hypothetical protein
MNANGSAIRGNSMIIAELRDDYFCMSARAGSERKMRMQSPVGLRARFFEKLFWVIERSDLLEKKDGGK